MVIRTKELLKGYIKNYDEKKFDGMPADKAKSVDQQKDSHQATNKKEEDKNKHSENGPNNQEESQVNIIIFEKNISILILLCFRLRKKNYHIDFYLYLRNLLSIGKLWENLIT